ncbi:MAG TPA: LysE family transporter [Opitutaceae bacterium]|nr:LysE family transporter [Opitutaceae bacterium]
MDWKIPFIGLAIGFGMSVPVGPVGLLVFRRSLLHHARAGIVTGLGAALADALLCSILAFGISAVSDFFARHAHLLENVGGFILVVIGYIVWHTSPPHEMPKTPAPRPGWFGAFSTSLLITIGNPMTLVGAGAIFAGFAIAARLGSHFDALMLVTGIFCGSTLWWVILSCIASQFRDKASGYWMRRLNQGCGIAVAVFGLVQIARVLLAACRG